MTFSEGEEVIITHYLWKGKRAHISEIQDNGRYIVEVCVDQLFGYLTYDENDLRKVTKLEKAL